MVIVSPFRCEISGANLADCYNPATIRQLTAPHHSSSLGWTRESKIVQPREDAGMSGSRNLPAGSEIPRIVALSSGSRSPAPPPRSPRVFIPCYPARIPRGRRVGCGIHAAAPSRAESGEFVAIPGKRSTRQSSRNTADHSFSTNSYGRPRTNIRRGRTHRRHSIPDSIPVVLGEKCCPWRQRTLRPRRIHRPYSWFRPRSPSE